MGKNLSDQIKKIKKKIKLTKRKIFVIYLLVWLLPLAGFACFVPRMSANVMRIFGGQTTSLMILAASAWLIVVFGIWIAIGDRYSAHQKNFERYKSIWVGFLIVLLVMLFANFLSFADVANRVDVLKGATSLLSRTVSNPGFAPAGMTYWVDRGLLHSKQLDTEIEKAETFKQIDRQRFDEIERNLKSDLLMSLQKAERALKLSRVIDKEKALIRAQAGLKGKAGEKAKLGKKGRKTKPAQRREAKQTVFKPMPYIINEIDSKTKQLQQFFEDFEGEAKFTAAKDNEGVEVLKRKAAELVAGFSQIQALLDGAKVVLAASGVSALTPFLLVAVLYSIFLLFPWALLFLFLLRKRDYLSNEKAQLLSSMDLDREFLERAGVSTPDMKGDSARRKKTAAVKISDLAFRNIEYVVSLALFTGVTAAIWHLFFYPSAMVGLAEFISRGGSVKAFAQYLASNATPITFGFLGAYFFVIQMLLRRYYSSDLNPKAYMNAVVRLLVVFILSLFFLLIPFGQTGFNGAAIAAFVVGIFPRVGLRWILQTTNKMVKTFKAPGYIDRHLLTRLDGLNTWHEARLLEEKVENIQNLATTPLSDLIIHTNFSPLQLVDWVDQGLLYIHTQEQWTDAFRAVGVRTATDLLRNTLKDDQFDARAAVTLATAINTAQAFRQPEPDSPTAEIRLAAAELHKATAEINEAAQASQGIASGLDGDKPETLDAIAAIQIEIEHLAESIKNVKDEKIKKATLSVKKIPDGNLKTKSKKVTGDLEKSATALSVDVDALKQAAGRLDRKKPETLTDLPKVKERLDTVCAGIANLKAQITAARKIADTDIASDAEQKELAVLDTALRSARASSEKMQKKAQDVRKMAASLNKDKPESLDMAKSLQARIKYLSEKVENIEPKLKNARSALKGIHASQSLVKEADKCLDAAAEVVAKLKTAAADANDASAPLDIDTPATMAGLPGVKESVAEIAEVAETVESRGQAAATALHSASAAPQMSKEILQVMVNSISEGPNIKELECFWKKQNEDK